jgi:hypothetical protein
MSQRHELGPARYSPMISCSVRRPPPVSSTELELLHLLHARGCRSNYRVSVGARVWFPWNEFGGCAFAPVFVAIACLPTCRVLYSRRRPLRSALTHAIAARRKTQLYFFSISFISTMQWFEVPSLRVTPQVKTKMQELLKVQHYHKVGTSQHFPATPSIAFVNPRYLSQMASCDVARAEESAGP